MSSLTNMLISAMYFLFYRKGGLLLNNVIGILGAVAMGASKVSELYELLIMGRYLIGVNCGTYMYS